MTTDTPPKQSRHKRMFGWVSSISMSSWLAIAVLVVTITSLVVTSILSLSYGQDLGEDLIDVQLESRAAVKEDEIGRYIDALRSRTIVLATSGATRDAVDRFAEAYAELGSADKATTDESAELVSAYYRDEFKPALEAVLGTTVGAQTLMPVGDEAIYLQRHYIVGVEVAEDRPIVDDAGDGSNWSEVHRELHPGFLEIAARLEVADVYLVEPNSGNIVYSTAKEADFATSLDVGPYGGSTLAAVMRMVREAPQRGVATLVDMAPYVPDFGAPMMFVASPILDGSTLTGILVLKVSLDAIDAVMTSDEGWASLGLGETGETYLAGGDGRMRSVSRPYVEDSEAFLVDLAAAGTATAAERDAIAGVETTAVFLRVADGNELADAATGADERVEANNYLQLPVLRAVERVDIEELDWFVLAEVGSDEIVAPITDFRRDVLIAVAVFVVAITFATAVWTARVFQPVRAISQKLRAIHEGEPVAETVPNKKSPREFAELSRSIDEMLASLRQREEDLRLASAERLDTIRSLLPAAVADRVESGDRNLIDRIPDAGVVVLSFNGLGEFVAHQDAAESREFIDQLVDEVDGLAALHGLERVKLVGDMYFAGCGLSQPYLDHVPRSVAFALEARDAVRELSASYPIHPVVAAGIDSGPVTVGLAGSARLVYDAWGETTTAAHYLARLAKPGEILISERVKGLLPPDISVGVKGEEPPVWEVTGHRVAEEVTP